MHTKWGMRVGDAIGMVIGERTGGQAGERVGDAVGKAVGDAIGIGIPRTPTKVERVKERVLCMCCKFSATKEHMSGQFKAHLLQSPECVTAIERVLCQLDSLPDKAAKTHPMVVWRKHLKWLPQGCAHHAPSAKQSK